MVFKLYTAIRIMIEGRFQVFQRFSSSNWYQKPLKAVSWPSSIMRMAVGAGTVAKRSVEGNKLYSCICVCVYIYIYTNKKLSCGYHQACPLCMHTYAHTYIHTYTHAYMHTYTHCIYTCTGNDINILSISHRYIHASIHTHIHTYTHAYIHVQGTTSTSCPFHKSCAMTSTMTM
jgi:hypothetical protein